MTDNNENLENEILEPQENPVNQENLENVPDGSENPNENQDPEIPEEPEIIEPQRNPWDDAPEGLVYFEKQYPDGHLGSFTKSAELAYKFGWFNNSIPEEDLEVSEINGWTYPKNLCPRKTQEQVFQEKKTLKLKELSDFADKFEQNKCDEMYITSSLGFRANADRRSLQNVSNLIDLGEATQYKDYDDQFHLLGVQDLQTLATEIKKNGANLYSQKFTMQYQISQIDNIQDLENFQIQFEMLDFTEV